MGNFGRFLSIFLIGSLVVSAGGAVVSAQASQARVERVEQPQAQAVRDELNRLLVDHPPALGAVLKLDPTLLNDQYLAPYPALLAFLNKHPEIRRNPSFFLESVRVSSSGNYYDTPQYRADRAWNDVMEAAAVLLVVLSMVGAFGWLIRTAVDYRRWGRLAKVQAEAHTKLLDRFTGNEELLAYVQSPAGTRFLQSSPISLDGNPRTMGSPVSRIMLSINAGIVLVSAGLGLNYVSRRVDELHADPIFMFSVLLLSIGLGFVGSAFVSYVLSRRMGMLPDQTAGQG